MKQLFRCSAFSQILLYAMIVPVMLIASKKNLAAADTVLTWSNGGTTPPPSYSDLVATIVFPDSIPDDGTIFTGLPATLTISALGHQKTVTLPASNHYSYLSYNPYGFHFNEKLKVILATDTTINSSCVSTISFEIDGNNTSFATFAWDEWSLKGLCGDSTYYKYNYNNFIGFFSLQQSSIPIINKHPSDPINLGNCSESTPNKPCTSVGNPINAITGNKIQNETDIPISTGLSYGFVRYYNSQSTETTTLGANWRSTYDRYLLSISETSIRAYRPDGQAESFSFTFDEWQQEVDTTSKLSALFNTSNQQTGWELVTNDDTAEQYDINGRLVSITTKNGLTTSLQYDINNHLTQVTGPFGHTLYLTYNASGLLSQLSDPAGNKYQYSYDTVKNLTVVRYPDDTTRQYAYNDPNDIHNLTGITDENGILYASWVYDELDRAISSEHAGEQEKVTIDYSSYPPIVTNALGRETSYHYTDSTPLRKLTGRSVLNCSSECGASTYNYTSNGFLVSKTDPNGVITTYGRNPEGLETSRTEAYGTPLARTITTTWHSTFHLPLTITETNRTTTFTYDDKGNLLSKTVSGGYENRTWSYTYNDSSQVITAADPRGQETTYAYNSQGEVATVTNPLGQITRVTSYDTNGHPLSVIDPNGLVTSLAYDARGRLISVTKGNEITRYTYNKIGNVTKITQPDNASITFSYDTAHRLTTATDNLGNRIVYNLDANGNKTKEEVFDNSGQLSRAIQHSYDTLNRLVSSVGSQGQTVTHTYDANGNLLTVTDPLSQITTNSYDSLNRLVQIIDPANGQTTIGYNYEHISPSSLTDPRDITTKYTVNGFDEQTKVISKETGTTSRTFDKAGNLVTTTDARGKTTTYSYDALNRMTGATFGDGSLAYQYDQGTNGVGRLTTMTYPSGTTAWTYDTHGRITRKQQSVNDVTSITSYQYNQTTGRLISTTYPSGKVLGFSYNTAGQVTRISVDGATLIDNITHLPFAFPASWSQGNGVNYSRSYNQDGGIVGISIGGTAPETVGISYDAAGRIIQISNSSALPVTADNESTNISYYTSKNQIISSLSSFSSTRATNKLYKYDESGNITSDGSHNFSYDELGRLIQVASDDQTTQYLINGFGQRVGKNSTVFVYDERGHLIGEYNSNGSVIQETIWLGDLPVAVLTQAGQYYINPDQIGAPLSITNSTGAVVWRWDHDPYGRIQPNQNPNNLGTFVYNLRFPGQYYDQESGLHYNWHRFYDPATGRYVTADPIGLGGGVNTYAYVGGNPVTHVDPLGLWYIDINATGMVATGGLQVGPNGVYGYTGVGIGWGAGFSITIHPIGDPTPGWTIGASVSGGNGLVGVQGTGSWGTGGGELDIGGGWGVGLGGAVTRTQTLLLLGFGASPNESSPQHKSKQQLCAEK